MALFLKDKRQVLNLPVDSIHPNPNQPRSIFSQAELQELSDSIVQLGILQPLSVRKVGGEWELISGEAAAGGPDGGDDHGALPGGADG